MKKAGKYAIVLTLLLVMTLSLVGCQKKATTVVNTNFHTAGQNPTSDIGQDGDVFFNNVTYDLFSKANGQWKKVANIDEKNGKGVVGAQIINDEIIITLQNGTKINAGSLKPNNLDKFPAKEAKNAFFKKMEQKAQSFGIDTSRMTIDSAISESSGNITSRDMVKLCMMTLGHDEIAKIWNQYTYTFKPDGMDEPLTIESTFMTNPYGHYLTDYYYVLGGKTGGLSNKPVANIMLAVKGPEDSTFVGFVSLKHNDDEELNRYKAAKIMFDIASAKYLDKNADTSALEAQLPADAMATVLEVPRTGNLLGYNHYDWFGEDSPYLLYDKNGTSRYYSASSWKVLTCMTALDYITDMEERIPITEDCIKGGSGPAFLGNEYITFRDCLHLILLPSSNTACVTMARAIGQKILESEWQVGGNPIFSPDSFNFDTAEVVSVAQAKAAPDNTKALKVRGVVIGGSATYDNGDKAVMFIKDETTGEIAGVAKLLTVKNKYQANMPFALGDIVEIPVVSEIVPGSFEYGGEHNKLTFTWVGKRVDYSNASEVEAFVAKYKVGHTDDYAVNKTLATRVIDSQQKLEEFIKTPNNHWELVILRGTDIAPLKAVTGASTTTGKNEKDMNREYIRFFFDNPQSIDEQKVVHGDNKKSAPVLSNFSNPNLPELLTKTLFNQTAYSQENFAAPYEFRGDIYCFMFGGSTSYFHFVVPDSSCIVPLT